MKTTLLSVALAAGFATTAMAQEDFKWQAFYTQTYENVAQIGDVWTAPSNQGGLSLVEEENGNHYVQYNQGNNNSRGLYNLDALTAEKYEGITEYRLEFDLALTPGSNQLSTFNVGGPDIQTMGSDWTTPCGNITKYPNNGLGSGSLFSLIQEATNSTQWRVYSQGPVGSNEMISDNDTYTIDLASDAWYHFALTVTPNSEYEGVADVKAEVADADGNIVMFNVNGTEAESLTLPYPTHTSGEYWFKQFYVLSGRYNSVMKIDNVLVMKKAAAGSVTPPTLAMTGVQMEGRIISLDNGAEADQLVPYYAIVDEAVYESAESAEDLTGTEYTAPFVVSEEMNYILAWNRNEAGKASELTKFTVEAGWAPKLNAPSISPTDFTGRKKTFTATCTQSDVKPLAPLSYTIYMSADSINWTEGNTYTVTEGKVYAKVEADGYAPAGCDPVEAPDGIYGATKWSIAGMVISNQDCVLESTGETYLNFGNSGKGRVHLPVQYWSEDYVSEDGATTYDEENAWAPLKKNGLHFNGGAGDIFILGSGNANGFTITGLAVYNSNKGYIKIDNLNEGDIIQVKYNDGSAQVLTVGDPETFTVPLPKYGGAALSTIEIKGLGTLNTRVAKVGEWGIITSDRTVVDVEQAGAEFYEHVYTIYNENSVADTLLLKPVSELKPGFAYIYKATADQIELATLEAEDPVDYQDTDQDNNEVGTLAATLNDPISDSNLYTFYPGGILMKNEKEVEIPVYSGCFQYLDMADMYADWLDYKMQDEYTAYLNAAQKIITDYENKVEYEYVLDENGDKIWDEAENDYLKVEIEKPALNTDSVYVAEYQKTLSKYAVIPVLHQYDENVANAVASVNASALQLVNVVTPAGVVVRRGVKPEDALKGLQRGLYIVGRQKVVK